MSVCVFSMTENGFIELGILDEKRVKWHEDKVDANNDLTFGDGAVQGDWRDNHKKVAYYIHPIHFLFLTVVVDWAY